MLVSTECLDWVINEHQIYRDFVFNTMCVCVCVKALQWLWQEDNLKLELDDMQKERESTQGERAKTVKDVLSSRCVRWQLLTLVIPCAGVQFCGINAVCTFQLSPS